MEEDADKLFGYNTVQVVNIQDWRLGWTNWCVQIIIALYIIIGIFIYGKGYLDFEQARGAIATHVRGDVVAVSIGKPGVRYFSAEDLTYPGLENGNVFVATRHKVTHQKRGVCNDHTMPCKTDEQCTAAIGGKCSEQGFCFEKSWCALEEVPEIYELEVGDLFVWVKSSIQFVRLAADKVYSTESRHAYPERGVNLFSVRDLLMMCKPVPVRYEEVSELGAAIEVQFIWNCNVKRDDCKPEVHARRLDVLFDPNHIGYAFNYAEQVSENERILNEMQGVRIFLRTYGTGQKASFTLALMTLATTVTLTSLGPIITELVMLNVMRAKKKYAARKYMESPDFSDLMKKMKEQKRKQEEIDNERNRKFGEEMVQQREQQWNRRLEESH